MCQVDDAATFEAAVGFKATGGRFVRPHPDLESRSASGRYDWPQGHRDSRWVYLPYQGGYYQVAMCWRNGANLNGFQEHWTRSVCNCTVPAPGQCVSPPTGCNVPIADFVNCFLHLAQDWPPLDGDILCSGKTTFGRGPLGVRIPSARLGNPGIIRHNHSVAITNPSMGCSPWLNAQCMGQKKEGPACSYSGSEGYLTPTAHGGSTHHQLWNWLELPEIACNWRTTNLTESEAAIAEAKQRTIQWLNVNKASMPTEAAAQNLDRVDLYDPGGNQIHDYWSRTWNAHTNSSTVSLASLATYAAAMGNRWENCYLARSGHPIIVSYVPWEVFIEVSVKWLNLKRQIAGCESPGGVSLLKWKEGATYPHVRVSVDVQMGIHLEWPDPGSQHLLVNNVQGLVMGQTSIDLYILNYDSVGRRHGKIGNMDIDSEPLDYVVFVDDDGRVMDRMPPLQFDWVGEMGPGRDDNNLFPLSWVQGGGWTGCCGVGERMKPPGLKIRPQYDDPIWPAVYLDGPARTYTYPNPPGQAAYIEAKRTKVRTGYVRVASAWEVQPSGCPNQAP